MDLLFKNPRYFFDTYFDFSFLSYFAVFGAVTALLLLIAWLSKKRLTGTAFRIILLSAYVALIAAVTLLGNNRSGNTGIILDPLWGIRQIIGGDRHFLRGMLSNVALFIPFGFLLSLNLKKRRAILAVLAGFLLSLTIEVLQLCLHVGCFETEDIICNTFGSSIGCVLVHPCGAFRGLRKLFSKGIE